MEFCDLAFHLTAPGDLTDEEWDTVLNYLHHHNQEQEKTQLYQIHRVYQALFRYLLDLFPFSDLGIKGFFLQIIHFFSISNNTVDSACDTFDEEKSETLKKCIHNYFIQKTLEVPTDWKNEVQLIIFLCY